MRFVLLFLAFLGLVLPLSAQKTLQFQPDTNAQTPPWALLMYQSRPNVAAVDSAYRAYYRSRDFTKTTHTQYYKKWRRLIEPWLQPDGSVLPPDPMAQNAFEQRWLQQRASAPKALNPLWRHLGPTETYSTNPGQVRVSWQANVYCIDQSALNPNLLFCGTEAGGIYKTVDRGLNWQLVSGNTLMRAVHSIRIDPVNPQIVYAGDNRRLYKTSDGGDSWQVILEINNLSVNDISVNPANPQIVLVAGYLGLYRSTDGGANWTNLYSGACWDIEVHPTQPEITYLLKTNAAEKRCEFFKSNDFGASFSIRPNGWFTSSHAERRDDGARMTVTPANPNVIYAVLAGNSKPGDNGFIGVFRSDNAGESWTLPNPPVGGPYTTAHPNLMTLNNTNTLYQGYYNLSIAASHTNANHVLIGGLNLWKTENGAQSFTPLGGYQGNVSWIHPDQQEIRIVGQDMWVASDGGINYSTNLFSTHESRKNGISASDFWGFGSGWNEDLIVGGRYHNGNSATRQSFPSGQFLRLGGGEAPTGYVNPGIPGKAYFSDISTKIIPRSIEEEVLSLPALGDYPGESYYAAHSSEMEFHPLCYREIYIGKDNQLWRSTNEGASFDLIHTFQGSSEPVMHIELSRSNPQVMYVFQRTSFYNATLWRSADGGSTWQSRALPNAPSRRAGTMSLSADDENTLWVAYGHSANDGAKIYKTTDGGLTWQNLSTPMLDGHTIHYVLHQAGTDGGVFAATNFAVFYRNNQMNDWIPFYDGLPAATNSNIMRPFYKTGKLRLATYSHGIWEADFPTPSHPLAQPMVDKRQSACVRDTFFFEDYSILNHDNAQWRWSFPGAAWVSDTTVRNPRVVFGQTGAFTVSLTVSDGAGISHTKTVPDMVLITEDQCAPDTIPGLALRLSGGVSDFAVAPALNTPTQSFTVSAWIKRDGTQPSYAGIFFSRGGNTVVGLNFGTNNELRYHWNDSHWNWNSGLVVPDGEWAHVALVVEPGRATIYLNGVPSVNNAAHAVQNFPADFYLGADPNHNGRRFKGWMEEVCIWNRALSRDEIRLWRHLVKVPQDDPGMLLYYQFNENTGDVLDRAGLRHARLAGAAVRVTSTCPVGPGNVSKKVIQTPGNYQMDDTGLSLTFPAGGILPNGEFFATRINLAPDQLPSDAPHSTAYWIINNYGSNSGFDPLEHAVFSRIGPISQGDAVNPEAYRLYHRSDNADGLVWQFQGLAQSLTPGSDGSASFDASAGIFQSGQFFISKDGGIVRAREEELLPYIFSVFPNPVGTGEDLVVRTRHEGIYEFALFDVGGKRVWAGEHRGDLRISIPDLPTGIYVYRIHTANGRYYGKVIKSD